MDSDFKGKVVLAVGAHPDDMEFCAFGTLAKLIQEGAEVYLLILTSGNRGSNLPDMEPATLAHNRREEQLAAAKIIGVKDVYFLDFNDGALTPNDQLKKEITKFIRRLKPEIVFSWDPSVYYSSNLGVMHFDHRAAGEATLDATYPLSRNRFSFPELEKEGLTIHQVRTMYLLNYDNADTFFDITTTFDLKIAALKKHQSQVDDHQLQLISQWDQTQGEKKGFLYAEGFKKINLLD